MNDELALLDLLAGKEGKKKSRTFGRARFEASIIATYNAYLPFYEDVVLRRLLASGCRHNVLLLDSGRLSESMASPTTRPRLAGQAYSLIPIRAPRAFHPKLAILVGKRHAKLILGSHNVTLSGFGHNRELSTEIDLPRGKDDPQAPVVIAAWRFLEDWLQQQTEHLPQTILDSAMRIASRFAPWLKGHMDQEGAIRFLGSSPAGPNLWEKLRPLLSGQPRRLIVLGPFFDHDFHFLKTIIKEFEAAEIVVGIEPGMVVVGGRSVKPNGIRFVDIAKIARGEGYLHAKALFIEFSNRDAVLVTGSANPSRPAFLENSNRRNAEAVLVHLGLQARLLADQLGILEISSMPDVSDEAWSDIRSRSEKKHAESASSNTSKTAIAVVDDGAIVVRSPGLSVELAVCYGPFDGAPLAESVLIEHTPNELYIRFPDTELSGVNFVELFVPNGEIVRAVVHNPMAIAKLSRTSSQHKFREALDSLDGESPDLPTIIRLAGKMIFDDDSGDRYSRSRGSKQEDGKQDNLDDSKTIDSLIVETRSDKKRQRRILEVNGGDLGYIIDTLIYQLGVRLRSSAEQLEHEGPSEEEQIGADDDIQPLEESPTKDLVKICHGKVRTLVNRMLKQLEIAHEGQLAPAVVVEQLLAVMAVLREIRRQDRRLAPVTGGESLIPIVQRKRLINGALKQLYERKRDLYAKAICVLEDDPYGDMPRFRGLLLWLAWDAGLDARISKPPGETYEQRKERLVDKGKLATLLPIVAADDEAIEEARRSIWLKVGDPQEADARLWLDVHLRWGREVLELFQNHHEWTSISTLEPGCLAIARLEPILRLRLLLHAHHEVARLIDIGESTGDVGFRLESVSFAKAPSFQ